MDVELRSKVKTLTENFTEIKSSLRWDGELINHLEALIYGAKEKEFNKGNIKEIRLFIKKQSSWNSPFRGDFQKIFSMLLDGREDYREVFNDTKSVYSHLLAKGFEKEDKTAFAALMLAMRFKGELLRKKTDKLLEIKSSMENMKLGNDYMSYANLAITNKEVKEIEKEVIEIYTTLNQAKVECGQYKEGFALAIAIGDGQVQNRIESALNIKCNLEYYSIKPSFKSYPLIGLSSLIIKNDEGFCKEVGEVFKLLREEKVFKRSMDDNFRLIISLGVVLNKYFEEIKADLFDINISEEINMLFTVEDYTALSIASL